MKIQLEPICETDASADLYNRKLPQSHHDREFRPANVESVERSTIDSLTRVTVVLVECRSPGPRSGFYSGANSQEWTLAVSRLHPGS